MFDMSKYDDIYNEIKNIDTDTLLQIIENAESKEEIDFFVSASNLILQEEQKKVIESGLF